jgi:hypothetical protein
MKDNKYIHLEFKNKLEGVFSMGLLDVFFTFDIFPKFDGIKIIDY